MLGRERGLDTRHGDKKQHACAAPAPLHGCCDAPELCTDGPASARARAPPQMTRSHAASGLRGAWSHWSLRRSVSTSAPSTEALAAQLTAECAAATAQGGHLNWVFLGAPGVGKGTYASRVAKLMGVPHVSCGDLVRDEIKAATPLAKQVRFMRRVAAVCWY